MGIDINWTGFNGAFERLNVPAAFQKGFDEGTARRQKQELQRALATYASNSADPVARRTLYTLNPQLAANLEDQSFQRDERQRAGEFRSAFGDYIAPGRPPNALGSLVAGPVVPDRPTDDNFQRSDAVGAPARPVAAGVGAAIPNALAPSQPVAFAAPAGPDPRLAARERALRADPEKFLTYEGKRIEVDSKRLEQLRDLNDSAMQILGGVHDDATLQAGKDRARAMYQQFGVPTDFIDQIPDAYSPEVVRSLQMLGMDTAKQLAAVARENKLAWDVEDDLLDNERADRNTESQIGYRSGQLANARRGQDLTHSRGIRGQDIASGDRRRGQDLTDSRGRRGQDMTDLRGRRGQNMTDRRGRESASFRGKGGRGGAATARIVNPRTGEAMILKNGQWVPER